MNRKTLEQQKAFYSLKCVERLKLAKEGKWFELANLSAFNLKPANDRFEDFLHYHLYDGVKKEFKNEFVSFFSRKRDSFEEVINILKEELKNFVQKERNENEESYNKRLSAKARKVLDEYLKECKSHNALTDNVKNKIKQVYDQFNPNFREYDYLSDYSSHAKRLPQMIVSSGLIPTLAFYKSKAKDRGQIYTDLCEILEVTDFKPYVDWKENKEGSLLLEFLLEADFQILRLATVETLAIANWLKRIVEVEIKEIGD